ncbi:MAG: hypothetical protein KIT00_00970, partial [Rhodospirillales bacterium]|nr:hypothetical protein [Rhodospirillales bacterium]
FSHLIGTGGFDCSERVIFDQVGGIQIQADESVDTLGRTLVRPADGAKQFSGVTKKFGGKLGMSHVWILPCPPEPARQGPWVASEPLAAS